MLVRPPCLLGYLPLLIQYGHLAIFIRQCLFPCVMQLCMLAHAGMFWCIQRVFLCLYVLYERIVFAVCLASTRQILTSNLSRCDLAPEYVVWGLIKSCKKCCVHMVSVS